MSENFGHYSRYYDLLYADKDYAGEVAYVRALIDKHSTRASTSLLELGCGTGIHAGLLSAGGIDVMGVDMSDDMLDAARLRAASRGSEKGSVSFHHGDARTFRAGSTFGAVAALFHVLSYQTSEADLNAMMETAAIHLQAGGLFLFDFWYGPAVLWQRPSVRTKRLSDDLISVTRIADPVIHDADNVVDVNYEVFITERATGQTQQLRETHKMRYLFMPEIDRLLAAHGFERVQAEEWMTRKTPSLDSWGVCVVARKR